MIIKIKNRRLNTRYAWEWGTEVLDRPELFCTDCLMRYCDHVSFMGDAITEERFFLWLRYGEKTQYLIPFPTEEDLSAVMEQIDREVL